MRDIKRIKDKDSGNYRDITGGTPITALQHYILGGIGLVPSNDNMRREQLVLLFEL